MFKDQISTMKFSSTSLKKLLMEIIKLKTNECLVGSGRERMNCCAIDREHFFTLIITSILNQNRAWSLNSVSSRHLRRSLFFVRMRKLRHWMKEGKNQKLIQSSTTPYPRDHLGM